MRKKIAILAFMFIAGSLTITSGKNIDIKKATGDELSCATFAWVVADEWCAERNGGAMTGNYTF